MYFLDLTFQDPKQNLALDEAILDQADQGGNDLGILRLWEPDSHFVVLGRSSRVDQEVNRDFCQERRIPILRRCSGGATVLAGPGCLMYAVVLSLARYPELRSVDRCHEFVLGKIRDALQGHVKAIQAQGISDLTIGNQKVSGNSLRCKQNAVLYHGTLLYEFDISLIGQALNMPERQPLYRENKPHVEFVKNLKISASELRASLIVGWKAEVPLQNWPEAQVSQLVEQKYARSNWNFRH